MKCLKIAIYFSVSVLFIACTKTLVDYSETPSLSINATWAIVPFTNHTETPLAGDRAASITGELLRSTNNMILTAYHEHTKDDVLVPDMNISSEQALLWAKQENINYLMMGDVNEWRYKVGLDGEPVVGVTLQLWDVTNQSIIWSAVGSHSGGSRVALSTAAQSLLSRLLQGLR